MTTTRPYESPLRAEQLEQTRLRILEAMADVLADEEVGEVTVPLVAMRARVSGRVAAPSSIVVRRGWATLQR